MSRRAIPTVSFRGSSATGAACICASVAARMDVLTRGDGGGTAFCRIAASEPADGWASGRRGRFIPQNEDTLEPIFEQN